MVEISFFEYKGMVSILVFPVKLSFLFIFTCIFLFFWFHELKMIFVFIIAKTSFFVYYFLYIVLPKTWTVPGIGPKTSQFSLLPPPRP